MFQRFLPLALAVFALAINPSATQAQVATPILTLPATITKPGIYTLKKNFVLKTTATAAITVNADSVIIDLGGHTLSTTLPAGTDVTGIRAEGHGDITIRNGTVRGFQTGIRLNSFQAAIDGVSVENVRIDGSESIGIELLGLIGAVRHCTIANIGGPQATSATGIDLDLSFATVLDNDILATVAGQGSSEGIHAGPQTSVIENNRVLNEPNSPGTTGIYIGLTGSDLVENNRITNFATGLKFTAATPPKYRNNFTAGCASPYVGGTDAGNNK